MADGSPSPNALIPLLVALAALLAATGCDVHYPVNPPLARHDPGYGHRFENSRMRPDQSADVLVVLLISGGGTRAAALAYGALESLRDTRIRVSGKEERLLDEVDYISAVSGGSAVAAYYGLYHERLFDDFGERFLYRDVQGELTSKLARNVWRIAFSRYGRGDLLADYLDEQIFSGATFRDLAHRPQPFVVISATDMSLGAQFPFSQERFDLLCSDLGEVPVARAVAASMALPPYFSPLTFRNYAGECGFQAPSWFEGHPGIDERTQRDLKEMHSYLDRTRRPYVHLFDGGLVDNLSLRQPMGLVMRRGGLATALEAFGFHDVRHAVFIAVDAERDSTFELDRDGDVPGPLATIDALGNVFNLGSFDSSVMVDEAVARWREELLAARPAGAPEVKFYLIDASLRSITDPAERERFMSIPTTLHLERKDVDDLRALARRLITAAPDFQALMQDIGAPGAVTATEK
ncbi:MAG: patatin-like phospholipase family protein [Betaproteobacteria bacterium]|nr:patatin-like phospholipase family protein [Betaproteobacteria bacterium]